MSTSAEIRSRLGHPVIDADGHMFEYLPLYFEFVRKVAGPRIAERVLGRFKGNALGFDLKGGEMYGANQDFRDPRRQDWRMPRGVWNAAKMDAFNTAAPFLPKLLHERMDDLGIDYIFLYPSLGLALPHEPDEELRLASVRALNTYYAEMTRGLTDRLNVAAVIPMHTPAEAIAELDHAVGALGAKTIMIPPGVMRPIPAAYRANPELFPEVGGWVDCFALDSAFDYDPFWRRCVELKVMVNCHGGQVPNTTWNGRSMSNFCFNHVGNMALQQHGVCKSLLMGGVTRRFPELQFGFLECGVGWACNLYSDLIGHWKKRNIRMLSPVPPSAAENAEQVRLFRQYGGPLMDGLLDAPGLSLRPRAVVTDPVLLDEWRALGIERAEEFKPLFTNTFNFGCEPDDPMTAWAFNDRVNPYGAKLKVMMSSDLGHWDTPDMTHVVEEAYEAVEHGLLTEEEFRAFTFTNVASAHLAMNPDFFAGTPVANAVGKLSSAAREAGKAAAPAGSRA